jgi:hypothetical protein
VRQPGVEERAPDHPDLVLHAQFHYAKGWGALGGNPLASKPR